MANLTGSRAGIGTPSYMSPEQGLGRTVDRRTDIYSLGIILYEMVTGRTPFRASTPEAIIDKHVREEPPRPKQFSAQLPGKVERILLRALEKNPSDRYQDAGEFARTMESLDKVNSSFPLAPMVAGGVILLFVVSAGIWYAKSIGTQYPADAPSPTSSILHPNTPSMTQTSTSTPTELPLATTTNTTNTGLEEITDSKGIVMRLVPEGTFIMGGSIDTAYAECVQLNINNTCDREGWFADEAPAHEVFVDAFYMDKYEVSNVNYRLCVESGECQSPFTTGPKTRFVSYGNPAYDDHPVINVNWFMADAYCKWRGTRLPTEAEWEKAARGTDGRLYPWGDTFDGNKANFCDTNCPDPNTRTWRNTDFNDGFAFSAPVTAFPEGASIYGIFNLAGNVWEWVADWYSETYYQNSPFKNPFGPISGEKRVERGGGWVADGSYLRTASRAGDVPSLYFDFEGFRCAMNANP